MTSAATVDAATVMIVPSPTAAPPAAVAAATAARALSAIAVTRGACRRCRPPAAPHGRPTRAVAFGRHESPGLIAKNTFAVLMLPCRELRR